MQKIKFSLITEERNSRAKAEPEMDINERDFHMDYFPGAVTSVDTDMFHDRCMETTLHYDSIMLSRILKRSFAAFSFCPFSKFDLYLNFLRENCSSLLASVKSEFQNGLL